MSTNLLIHHVGPWEWRWLQKIRSLVALALLSVTGVVHGRALDESWLAELRQELNAIDPRQKAGRERVSAANEGSRAIRRWENPKVGVSILTADPGRRRDDGDYGVGIEQELPVTRRFQERQQLAKALSGVRDAELALRKLEVERELVRVLADLAGIDSDLRIKRQEIEWLEVQLAYTRGAVGNGMRTAIESARLDTELTQERIRLTTSELERFQRVRSINLLLGRDRDSTWEPLVFGEFVLGEDRSEISSTTSHRSHPQLEIAEGMTRQLEAEERLERLERKPVFGVGVEGRGYSGGGFRETMFTLSMTIPWFNGNAYRAGENRVRHERMANEQEWNVLKRDLDREREMAVSELAIADQQLKAYREEILPRLKKTVELMEQSWTGGKVSLTDILMVRREFLAAQGEVNLWRRKRMLAQETLRAWSK